MALFYFCIALFFLQWSKIRSSDFDCSYYSKLYLKPQMTDGCENYICWESQLTDIIRNQLLSTFNDYRSYLAKGKCASCKGQRYGVIYSVYYHWLAEYTCVLWLENIKCTLPLDIDTIPSLPYKEVQKQNLNAGLLGYYVVNNIPLRSYGSINTFKLEYNEFRNDVIQKIKTVLKDEEDSKRFLNSWKGENKYIYGGYPFFGCAILVLNNMTGETDFGGSVSNERVAFLACMFVPLKFKGSENDDLAATPTGKSFSIVKSCSSLSVDLQGAIYKKPDEKQNLCTFQDNNSTRSLQLYDMPCQVYYHTYEMRQVERCDNVPSEWSYNVYPNNESNRIVVRRLEIIDPKTNQPTVYVLDRLNPSTTTTKFTTLSTRKPKLITTTSNPSLEDDCSSFLSIHCASLVTIFIIVSVFAFIVLICLITR